MGRLGGYCRYGPAPGVGPDARSPWGHPLRPSTHRVHSGRKHVGREPHPRELASLDSKSSRTAMPCRSDRRAGSKTGRRLRSRTMIYADRDPPVIISRAYSARLPAERRASSPAEPTTFTPVHFWTGQIQCLSARHTEVPCRSHRLAVSPHGRRDAARTGAPCWSKRRRTQSQKHAHSRAASVARPPLRVSPARHCECRTRATTSEREL